MITPMKQLDLLLFHEEKEAFLEALREAGVVHITEDKDALSEKGIALQSELVQVDKVLTALPKPQDVTVVAHGDGKELIEKYHLLISDRDSLLVEKDILKKELNQVTPWGEISQESLTKLANSGVFITLFEVPKKLVPLLTELTYEVISDTKGKLLVAVITEGEPATVEGLEKANLPSRSLSEIEKLITLNKESLEDIKTQIESIASRKEPIVAYRQELLQHLLMEKARTSMAGAAKGHLLHLHGWFPKATEVEVMKVLEEFSCWYETAEPKEDDRVPVKLKNNAGAQLFEPIVNIYSLPDYFELDPTFFIAPFFAFFFGLCLGDLGYGIMLMIIAIIGIFKAPEKLKPIMKLGGLLGIMTAINGVFLNTFFGHAIFDLPGASGYLSNGAGFALLGSVETESGSYFPAMPFSLYVGVFQILFATVLNMINRYRNSGFVYILQPLGAFFMTVGITIYMAQIDFIDLGKLTLGTFALGPMLSAVPVELVYGLLITGLTLTFLFNSPEKKIGARLGIGFWELYQYASALMGDSLSYLRLFALGLAGGLLGAAFNQIAFMFITLEDGTVNYASIGLVATIIVLVVGHTLNFALAILGAFVHPLRLTFVEFYKNLDFKGGAIQYKPLSYVKKQ